MSTSPLPVPSTRSTILGRPSGVVARPAAPGSTPVSKIATMQPRPSYSGCFASRSVAPISVLGIAAAKRALASGAASGAAACGSAAGCMLRKEARVAGRVQRVWMGGAVRLGSREGWATRLEARRAVWALRCVRCNMDHAVASGARACVALSRSCLCDLTTREPIHACMRCASPARVHH